MEEEKRTLKMTCSCGHDLLLYDYENCSYYCEMCFVVNEEVIETAVADEDIFGNGAIYRRKHTRHRPSQPATNQSAQDARSDEFWSKTKSSASVENPDDYFGLGTLTSKDCFGEVRMRYVMGLQIMIQRQCEKLVKEFNVTPLICGLVGPIWLRFVALSGVFDEDWAEKAIKDSEVPSKGEEREIKQSIGNEDEPRNIYGKSASMILVRSLRKSLPLISSLAISFLACHVARVCVLPTDIAKWALDERICYLSCYAELGKQMGERSEKCPVSVEKMFKPYSETISSQRLETLAASIADTVGLSLPPVNFYAIASLYLRRLSLPIDKIFPQACRIHTWSMPPELYLSMNESKFPTRVCVMSILMVAIRILYNINGFGVWEKSLRSISSKKMKCDVSVKSAAKSSGDVAETEFDTEELLKTLEKTHRKSFEHEKGLAEHLERFRELSLVSGELTSHEKEESKRLEMHWKVFSIDKTVGESEDVRLRTPCKRKRSSDHNSRQMHQTNKHGGEERASSPQNQTSAENVVEKAIRRLKSDMEDDGFFYVTPRVKPKRLDYLHYVTKQESAASNYAVHADYYILLRSCAKVAEIDVRIMHKGVLSFEKRLDFFEKRIEDCLHLIPPPMECQHCKNGGNATKEPGDL